MYQRYDRDTSGDFQKDEKERNFLKRTQKQRVTKVLPELWCFIH